MIVDDSIVARTVIARLIEAQPGFELAACASNADAAIDLLGSIRVDVIILDLEMPGTDGLTALPRLLADSDGARVLIVSSACAEGAATTVRALTLGAADTLLKPGAGSFAGRFTDMLVERVRRIARTRRPAPPAASLPRSARTSAGVAGPIKCIAIGASTGGLHALSAFLRALPPEVDAPILVTQHLPPIFIPYFAAQLRDIAGRPARMAVEGAVLHAGEMLIAPGDAHMRLSHVGRSVRVRLDRAPAASGCLPSVDPMFDSVATIFGAAGVGVVLSGMGRDGAIGASAMVEAGGEILAQDADSAVVWGMPGAVANAGLASAILPPARIAQHIEARASDAVSGVSRWR